MQIDQLRSSVAGVVAVPGDAEYERVRLVWNRVVELEQRPAVIVEAAGVADVVAAVRFAREAGLGVAVQSTGHGVIHSAGGDALLLAMGKMNSVTVDVAARTARIGAGVMWGAVLAKTHQAGGLAPLLGSSPGVGAAGYTLGGGLGWLVRKYGVACDSVRAFQIVTADGEVRRVSAESAAGSVEADLWWALRGGGASFGVVTEIEVGLVPVNDVFGGDLFYSATDAREVLRRYRDWAAGLPEDFTTSVMLQNYPDAPALPAFLRGRSVVRVLGCFDGPEAEGRRLLAGLTDWREPESSDFSWMSFSRVGLISKDPLAPAAAYNSGAWMRGMSDASIDALVDFAFVRGAGLSPAARVIFAEVRHVAGAAARVGESGSAAAGAYDNREAGWILNTVMPARTVEAMTAARSAMTDVVARVAAAGDATGGVYPNFLTGSEAFAKTRAAFSAAAYERLCAVKTRVDAGNLFRYGLDIQPLAKPPAEKR